MRKQKPLFPIQYTFSNGNLIDTTQEDDIVNEGKVKASPQADMKVLSLGQDLIYATSNGTVPTLKHSELSFFSNIKQFQNSS